MTTDARDKTVFRQPALRGDQTVIRPSPGGRGTAPQGQGVPQQSPVSPPPGYQPAPAVEGSQNRPVNNAWMEKEAVYFRTGRGLNPLVNAASSLLAVFEKTRFSINHPDIGGLHQRLVNEIRAFENRVREKGVRPEIALSARYVLCTVLDEAVLNTPWGSESAWTQKTLLSIFHNETAGGEKFFLILDRMRDMPAENRDMLELMYLCLSLGYEGKYRLLHRGKEVLEQTREDLFHSIRMHRGAFERSLSPSWQGLGRVKNTLAQYVPMWVVASVVAGIILFSYTGFRYWMHLTSTPVVEQLQGIAAEKPVSTGGSRLQRTE